MFKFTISKVEAGALEHLPQVLTAELQDGGTAMGTCIGEGRIHQLFQKNLHLLQVQYLPCLDGSPTGGGGQHMLAYLCR